MTLSLTTEQIRRIRETQEVMLSPFRFSSPGGWADAMQEEVSALFGVERSAAAVPVGPDDVEVFSPNLAPDILNAWSAMLVGAGSESNRYADPMMERAQRRMAASGVEVWNRDLARRLTRIPLEVMPRVYPEVIQPARLQDALVMGGSVPRGRAMLALFCGGPKDTRFGEDETDVFRLLLPAFEAGARGVLLSALRRRRLNDTFDLLEDGIAVFRDGTEEGRNRALRRILEAEVERTDLEAEIAARARRFFSALRTGVAELGHVERAVRFSTAGNSYRMAASHFAGGGTGEPSTIVVVVRPSVPPIPGETELRERYGLTERQAEVAVLLAHGESNRAIARRLDISPHTARHHAQKVLEKVGTESRKALGLRFLSDRM